MGMRGRDGVSGGRSENGETGHMRYLLQAISDHHVDTESGGRASAEGKEGGECRTSRVGKKAGCGSKERDLELRRAKNRESAKRSRVVLKEKRERLMEELAVKEEVLQRLNAAYQMQAEQLKMARLKSQGVVDSADSSVDLSSSTSSRPLHGHLVTRQEVATRDIVRSENSLYVKLLCPDPHLSPDLLYIYEDRDRERQLLTSPAQKLDTLLHVYALDCEGIIATVRHQNVFSLTNCHPTSLIGKHVWKNVHENDADNVRRIVMQYLDQVRPSVDTSPPLVFAYRRRIALGDGGGNTKQRSTARYTRMKATLEPIVDCTLKVVGLIFAEFHE